MSTTTGHGSKVSAWKILSVMLWEFVVSVFFIGIVIGVICAIFYGVFFVVRQFGGTGDAAIATIFLLIAIGLIVAALWEAIGGIRRWWRQTKEDLERQRNG